MNDAFANAFTRTAVPEPGPDFERRVVSRVLSSRPARTRRIRQLLRAYWLAVCALSIAVVAAGDASALSLVAGVVSLAAVVAGAALAAGGLRGITRAFRMSVQ